jgi:transcription initiation factor TFIID subunit 5
MAEVRLAALRHELCDGIPGGFADSSIRLYDFEKMAAARELPRGKRRDAGVQTMHGHSDAVYGLSYSPDRRYMLSASGDGTVRFWSTALAANLAVYR